MNYIAKNALRNVFNEQSRRENELQREVIKRIEDNEFLPENFYKIKRDGSAEESEKDIPVKIIAEELKEILGEYRGQEETVAEKMKRLERIYYYMSDYGILENTINVVAQKRTGYFISQLGNQSLKERICNMYSNIDPNNLEEVATMEAFLANRMEKITEKIMSHYFREDVLKNMEDMYVWLARSGLNMTENDILAMDDTPNNEFKEWHKKWCKDNKKSPKTNTVEKFISYVKLRSYKNELYAVKNNAIELLCENYKDDIKDYTDSEEIARGRRSVRLLYIKLKDYGLPIGLHIPERCFRKNFAEYGIEHATNREMAERISGVPLKMLEEEQEEFMGIVNNYLGITSCRGTVSRTPVVESEKIDEQRDTQTENPEIEKAEVQEEKNTEEPNKTETAVQHKRKGKEAFYKTNDETVEQVTSVLKDNGVISQMPEEIKEKMLHVTASQKTKMEKIMLDMRKYLTQNGVSDENLDVETAKMFAYSKLLNRGFWIQVSGERDRYYEKAYKELQEHGNEFFDKLNSGMDLEELKKEMNTLTNHRRGVRGARTIKQVEKEEVKEEIEEQDNKNEEISNEPMNEVPEVNQSETNEEKIVEENQSDIVIEVHREEPVEEVEKSEEIESTQQEEYEELEEVDPLQKEIDGINAEYNELKAKEEAIKQRKEQWQVKLDEIINSKEPLKKRRLKIKVALRDDNMKLLQELGMGERIQSLLTSLEVIEKEMAEQEQKEKEAREGIAHADEELNQMQEKKDKIKTKLEDLFRDI